MSIMRAALRLAAVAALRDRCWRDIKVYDSDNRPLESAIREEPKPYIVVYTDDDDIVDIDGRAVTSGSRKLNVTIEFGIAAPVPAGDGDDANAPKVAIPATDGAFELTLDLIDRQVMDALILDPRSTWGELFRDMTSRVEMVNGKRGGEAEKGVRWAARQRIIQVEPLIEPQPGKVLDERHPLRKFMTAAAADAAVGIRDGVAFLNQVMVADNDWSWRQAQGALGLTIEEVRGIGIAPVRPEVVGDIEAPRLSEDETDLHLPQEEYPRDA